MNTIEKSWYKPVGLITLLLLPLSVLFWLISITRKWLYSVGILRQFKSKIPIIVVGNISVGGNGKTPFVLWLYDFLTKQGLSVGVISRGYGGKAGSYPLIVTNNTSASEAGDEPKLLFHRLKCPIAIGPNRQHNIELLVREYNLDIIISDDGMQHYKMARTIECCIVDSERQFGNGLLMPAGPLRETPQRLKSVDLVVENGGQSNNNYTLQPAALKSVKNSIPVAESITKGHAVSAIGNPKRFENTLIKQGITLLSSNHFRDHYAYTAEDFKQFGNDNVLMTEKDAVKCGEFAKDNWYYLPVDAKPTQAVINKLTLILKEKGILNGL
ncbi:MULTISPECIES: tetraacyldisaccharide 4'-kinase [unclassified Pseudoalteromonas]|uniref:tetraacyldisaccharide 4'-kinase n=1 Tax=unclassified Pseudoalteromonas TaxID=194690 RepID=UPI001108F94E|nr:MULTISPECIES: tetraacyldisaccharide 4'-kinase [unclassified Pseudoalteromonas]TMN82973.1 tetraacyldisaccharide 4'-kinase [Pseudoalteromonas sp. S410]TMN90214.1 tetraacyldisaccharide 4'-kinase [Pseudoalteromonas sp. S408]TMN99245.1 tetraacyldisaccharide 4'-kinase [Pseudoalteromonas sp. S409]TMO00776.1 tetraacyldisaccharide 4'-kinase [Pseudoalteromonas sp. S407]TMO11170.1 tetraacyldisaccharide 4'-kinase [Pseudoalteromonas sp. S186]